MDQQYEISMLENELKRLEAENCRLRTVADKARDLLRRSDGYVNWPRWYVPYLERLREAVEAVAAMEEVK